MRIRSIGPVIAAAIGATLLAARLLGQQGEGAAADQKAAWNRIKSLAGTWKGTDDTKAPPSTIERNFEMIVQDRFLLVRTKSASAKETHEDWAIFSYDGFKKKVMMRQFAGEGFINRFALDEISPDGNTLTFLSEDCENAPPGFRVRMEYTLAGDDEFSQRMHLAPRGKEFSQCVGGTLRRE